MEKDGKMEHNVSTQLLDIIRHYVNEILKGDQ